MEESAMWKWMGATVVAVAVAVSLGCAQQPRKMMPVIEDKIDRDAYIGGGHDGDRRPRNDVDKADRAGRAGIGPHNLPDESHGAVQTEG